MLEKRSFGKIKNGKEAFLYVLENKRGMKAYITDYGAALVKLKVPDKSGNFLDVVLGYDDVSGYENCGTYFGATVGRCANRINGASFVINKVTYHLAKNENNNCVHSGGNYYNKRFWQAEEEKGQSITFALHSPDGDQGFPGDVDVYVTYELTDLGELSLKYYAVPGKDTIINMTNHSYFNLAGQGSGDILDHIVFIDADSYTRTDSGSIPTGELVDVTDTPMDFRKPEKIGKRINNDYEALKIGKGYDHNWALNHADGIFSKAAEAYSEKSGIAMEVWTDLPGMQMYTGNFLDNEQGKGGFIYQKNAAVCFETQYFPDAIHHENFKSPVCKAGKEYKTTTSYKFFVK